MLLPFGEYRPDVSDYEGQHSKRILNVVPQGDGYGPFMSLAAYSTALSAACRGLFYALKSDGSVAIFAGTATKLYLLNNTNQTWTDVSQGASTYTSLANNRNWSFVQFNNYVIAVHGNVNPQVYDLSSPSAFADLGGSPPKADYVAIVNRFVVLSGLPSAPYRVQWSGLNAVTTWDNITSQSNYQDMADGGVVRGVMGGEYGTIFQDRSIRRMIYQPGSSLIFGIDRISLDDGLDAPYSLVQAGGSTFFLSPQGFKKMAAGGGYPEPIGKERIDRTFFGDWDSSNIQLVIGVADPAKQRVYWTYKPQSGAAGLFSKILAYDYVLDRWAPISQTGEYLTSLAVPGLTLEGVDAAYDTGSPVSLTSVTTSTSAIVFGLVGHGLSAGQGIIFPNAIVGVSANTPYYVKSASLTSSSFQVSATGGVGALEGTAVGTTSTSTGGSGTYIVSNIDTLTIGTFDSIAVSALPQLSAVDSSHKAGYFTGEAMEATLETAEHGNQKRRIFVRQLRPAIDAETCFASITKRERLESSVSYTTEEELDAFGTIPFRVSTRYARANVRIPAGTSWTFAAGVEPDVGVEGER